VHTVEAPLDLLGGRARGEVEVANRPAERQIAHGSADKPAAHPELLQARGDLLGDRAQARGEPRHAGVLHALEG
jgi:hypothetical protein